MKKLLAVMVLLLSVSWINAVDGATLYYSSVPTTDTQIYRIDSVSGVDSLLTTITGVQYYGLATSSIPDTIYGIDTTTSTGCLYTFNVSTLANTLIGCAGIDIREIAYNLNTKILYGTNYSNLYTINTATGAATLVGAFGGLTTMWSMGVDQGTNTLYGTDFTTSSLYTINTATGAATLAGATGFSRITDIYVDPGTTTMYGVGNGPNNFYSINKTTGAATIVSALKATAALGLAAPPASLSVPTMNEWGMIIFMALAAFGSLYYMRRNRAES